MTEFQQQTLLGRSVKLSVSTNDGSSSAVGLVSAIEVATDNVFPANGRDFGAFDISFEVTKTLKPTPNACSVKVWNLSEDSRKAVSGINKLTLRLDAGYGSFTSQLYLGEVRSAWTVKEDVDYVTIFESGDGEKEIANGRINASLGAQVPVSTAMDAIANALGLAIGNADLVTAKLLKKGITSIPGGSLSGLAAERLTDFCRSADLEWSVQDGALQILNIGETINKDESYVLSEDTGMVESPTVDSQGVLSIKTLILPGIRPGHSIYVDSLFFKGYYRIQQIKWTGSTFENDWYCTMEGIGIDTIGTAKVKRRHVGKTTIR